MNCTTQWKETITILCWKVRHSSLYNFNIYFISFYLHVLAALMGRYLQLLYDCTDGETIMTFEAAIKQCKIDYKPPYAKWLIKLSTLLQKFPKLMKSSMSVHFFKANFRNLERICFDNEAEWAEEEEEVYCEDRYIWRIIVIWFVCSLYILFL